jgi:hypothetical protein
VAACLHGDTPYSGKAVTSVPVTPYTTPVDVNVGRLPDPDLCWLCVGTGDLYNQGLRHADSGQHPARARLVC